MVLHLLRFANAMIPLPPIRIVDDGRIIMKYRDREPCNHSALQSRWCCTSQFAYDLISAWVSARLEWCCCVGFRGIGEVEVEGKIKAN